MNSWLFTVIVIAHFFGEKKNLQQTNKTKYICTIVILKNNFKYLIPNFVHEFYTMDSPVAQTPCLLRNYLTNSRKKIGYVLFLATIQSIELKLYQLIKQILNICVKRFKTHPS